MTYAQFLAIFLALPLLGMVVLLRHRLTLELGAVLAAVALLALVYTGPWDNAIIANGVWSYGAHQVFGLVIGRVPIEEYTFYIFQVALTGLLTVWILKRAGP